MKILAFLQNPWFRPGTEPRHVEMYRADPDFRRRVLAMSATGRALRRAFGEELYSQIVWDNANPLHGWTSDSAVPPDVAHMAVAIVNCHPDVVLLFGRQAQRGWAELCERHGLNGPTKKVILFAPHPMARGSATRHLGAIAAEVRALCAS